MMIAGDIRDPLKKQPFEPFWVCLSDGRAFDVRHPDLCMVGRNTIYVGIPDPKDREIFSRVVHCAIMHITCIEPVSGHRRMGPSKRKRQR
ncbi:MAG: hypothetical protein AABZ47_12150 [Planctomycetota bacterium]